MYLKLFLIQWKLTKFKKFNNLKKKKEIQDGLLSLVKILIEVEE